MKPNSRGFTLVELMVASGIGVMLVLAGASFFAAQSNFQTKSNVRNAANVVGSLASSAIMRDLESAGTYWPVPRFAIRARNAMLPTTRTGVIVDATAPTGPDVLCNRPPVCLAPTIGAVSTLCGSYYPGTTPTSVCPSSAGAIAYTSKNAFLQSAPSFLPVDNANPLHGTFAFTDAIEAYIGQAGQAATISSAQFHPSFNGCTGGGPNGSPYTLQFSTGALPQGQAPASANQWAMPDDGNVTVGQIVLLADPNDHLPTTGTGRKSVLAMIVQVNLGPPFNIVVWPLLPDRMPAIAGTCTFWGDPMVPIVPAVGWRMYFLKKIVRYMIYQDATGGSTPAAPPGLYRQEADNYGAFSTPVLVSKGVFDMQIRYRLSNLSPLMAGPLRVMVTSSTPTHTAPGTPPALPDGTPLPSGSCPQEYCYAHSGPCLPLGAPSLPLEPEVPFVATKVVDAANPFNPAPITNFPNLGGHADTGWLSAGMARYAAHVQLASASNVNDHCNYSIRFDSPPLSNISTLYQMVSASVEDTVSPAAMRVASADFVLISGSEDMKSIPLTANGQKQMMEIRAFDHAYRTDLYVTMRQFTVKFESVANSAP